MNQTNIQIADQNRSIALPTDILAKYKDQFTAGTINQDQFRQSALNDIYGYYGLDANKYQTGLSQGNSAYNENPQNADQAINFLKTAGGGTVGGQALEAALRGLTFNQTNLAPQNTPTREPAPTVQGLTPAEIAQNQKADAAYQERLKQQGGGMSQADLLLQQAQQMLNGGQPQVQSSNTQQNKSSVYQGPSIVDYLNSTGQASDFQTRAALAAQMGIKNYTGSAAQNTQLLNTLRSSNGQPDTANFQSGMQSGQSKSQSSSSQSSGGSNTASPETQSLVNNATSIAESLGYQAPSDTESPQNQITNLYTQALTSLGIPSLQSQLKTIADQQAELQTQKANEADSINNDPWISEGLRVNKLKKLDAKYETRELILTNKLELYQSAYDKGISQAQWEVGQITSAMNNEATNNANIYEKALTIAQQQATALASASKSNDTADIKNYEYAVAQGYKGTMTQWQREQANLKTPSESPTISDKVNNAYAGITQLLVPGAKIDGIPFLDSDKYLTVQGFNTLVNAARSDGISREDFIKQYAGFISPYNPKNYGLTPAEVKIITGE